MTVLNSKFEFNRCLIPTIVTDDPRTKPYQTSMKYDRDPDEEEDETWVEDINPQKRQRNQELRRRTQGNKYSRSKFHNTFS